MFCVKQQFSKPVPKTMPIYMPTIVLLGMSCAFPTGDRTDRVKTAQSHHVSVRISLRFVTRRNGRNNAIDDSTDDE